MIEERLLDTKRTLEKLATQTGKSMEDILRSLCEGNLEFVPRSGYCLSDPALEDAQTVQNILSQHPKNHKNSHTNHGRSEKRFQEYKEDDKIEQIDLLVRSAELIENSIMDLNVMVIQPQRAITMVNEDIVEQMVTKKIYKIRQSFREQILNILGVKELAFYGIHDSGRIEFQDFSSNFITEIMDSDIKCQLLEKTVFSSEELHFVDLADNSDMMRLFELDITTRNQYFGVVVKKTDCLGEENVSYCLMTKTESYNNINNIKGILTGKLIRKIVEISQISTSQDSINRISKLYSKLMLDFLQILIINYDSSLKKSLSHLHRILPPPPPSLRTLIKIIISKTDENLGNEQSIDLLRKLANQFQEMQYTKIEQIRMYQKYIRDNNVILMEFNRVGVLLFLSGNRDFFYLDRLGEIWGEGKPVMDAVFQGNQKFQVYLNKAVRGALRGDQPVEIANSVKAKITTNGKKIQKIYITIEDNKQEISSVTSSVEECALKKKDTNSTRFGLKMLEKQNPGILKEGWLNLFLKTTLDQQFPKENRERRSLSKRISTDNLQEQMKRLSQMSLPVFYHDLGGISLEGVAIDNPYINLLTFSQGQLQIFAIMILDKLEYFNRLPKERVKLISFINQLHDNYQIHQNPFHNFTHGINVMHSTYLLSSIPSNSNILTPEDIFANVFSGLCHDVGHTGFTNPFQIASRSQKAMIYNDKSPLQNFHASLTFQLLRKEENNFLCHLDRVEFAKFRKSVIENILYTDIKEHFPLLNSFNQLLKSGKTLGREDAPILSYMIVHSSDFAGSTKQFQICKQWSLKVNQQFSNQYKIQGELGIPQTPFMKDLSNPMVLSKAQCGFLKVIVYPLYQSLDAFYHNQLLVQRLKRTIEFNIKGWEELNKVQIQKAKMLEKEKEEVK